MHAGINFKKGVVDTYCILEAERRLNQRAIKI